jgi:hypothetical protein
VRQNLAMSTSQGLSLREALSQVAEAIRSSTPPHQRDGIRDLSDTMHAASVQIQRCRTTPKNEAGRTVSEE